MKFALFSTIACLCLSACAAADQFHVLALYNGNYDEAHINFVHEANAWFPTQAEANGFTYTASNDWGKLNDNELKKYQVVLFLDDAPSGNSERQAFQRFIENGGGFIGFHASAFVDNPNEWTWFHDTLLGTGTFQRNTWWPTKVKYHIDNPSHPAMKGLEQKFESSVSEWYAWQHDLRKNSEIEVLASIDNSSFPVGTDCPNQCWYSGYFPLIWSHKKYKAMYCNFGHNYMDYAKKLGLSKTFDASNQNKFLFQALHYLAGK